MVDEPIFELPIYRCSEDKHYLECKGDIEKQTLLFRKPLDISVAQYFEETYKTPWNYNEVISWLVIYAQGMDLVVDEWRDSHNRIFKNRKRDFRFNTASAIRIRVSPEDSSEKIFEKLLQEIERYGKEPKLKNRYIDTSKLENIGLFVNWRALMDAEFLPNEK